MDEAAQKAAEDAEKHSLAYAENLLGDMLDDAFGGSKFIKVTGPKRTKPAMTPEDAAKYAFEALSAAFNSGIDMARTTGLAGQNVNYYLVDVVRQGIGNVLGEVGTYLSSTMRHSLEKMESFFTAQLKASVDGVSLAKPDPETLGRMIDNLMVYTEPSFTIREE